jgi:putative flavoprotein involved in K+ transport
MAFPALGSHLPSKDEMADYLEAYAERFALPVQLSTRVDQVSRDDEGYLVSASDHRWRATRVIVATGATPWKPRFADQLDPAITQLHSAGYRGSHQHREGGVLVVGAGNSGAEIALEVASRHPTWLAGRDTGFIRVDASGFGYQPGSRVFPAMRFLTEDTWLGRSILARAR